MDAPVLTPISVVPSGPRQNKKRILLFGLAASIVVGIIIFLVSCPGSSRPENNGKTPIANPTVTEEVNNKKDRDEALGVVNTVHNYIKTGELDKAAEYFVYGLGFWQSKDAVIKALQQDKILFSENGQYQGVVSPESSEIVKGKAQVMVLRTIQGAQRHTRYDLNRTPAGWKIVTFSYDNALDLAASERLRKEHQDIVDNGEYSRTPITHTLPTGDTVEVRKNFFSSLRKADGSHEDIEVRVISAKNNLQIAVFDLSRIIDVAKMRVNDASTDFHAFDIRALVENGGGVIIFYPEDIDLSSEEFGKPAGAIYEIPVRIKLD